MSYPIGLTNQFQTNQCAMNFFSVYLVFVLLVIGTLRFLWMRRRWYALACRLKGNYGYPLIGNAHHFVRASKVVDKMQNFFNRHGNLCQVWMGTQLYVLVNDPVNAEKILNSQSCLEKGGSYYFINQFFGRGLVTLESSEWKVHRKLINPSFSYGITNKFVPIFNKHMRIMSDCLERKCGQPAFDILVDMKRLAMDMICETTMDRPTNTQSGLDGEYFDALDFLLRTIAIRMFNPIYQNDLVFRFSKYSKRFVESGEIFNRRINEILAEKIKSIEDQKLNGMDLNAELDSKTDSFIDRLLKLSLAEGKFSLDDVVSETNTILVAGFETTAIGSAFVMLMLAMHPELQERVYEEVKTIPFAEGVDITHTDVSDLTYLDMFIKETMRMFPALSFLTRSVSKDIQIGGYTIPKGVELVLSVMGMHRSKDNFNLDPNAFNPDNFLPENSIGRHPYSYIPFSSGPRGCIGTKYAMLVLKLVTVYVLRKYRLTTELRLEDLRLRINITLKLLNKHRVQLHKRDDSQ